MGYTIKPNGEFKSAEIYFNEKPSETVRAALKAAGFRWHGLKKCWCGKMTTTEANVVICKATGAIPDGYPKMDAFDSETAEKMQNAIKAIEKTKNAKAVIDAEKVADMLTKSPEAGTKGDLPDHWRKVWRDAGIKGVTVRNGRGGYSYSFTFTFRMVPGDVLPESEALPILEEEFRKNPAFMGQSIQDPDQGEDAGWYTWTTFYDWDGEKQKRYYRTAAERAYRRMIKDGPGCIVHAWSIYLNREKMRREYPVFTDQFWDRLEVVARSVACFNYDNSDAMTDYFDVGFYESWDFVAPKEGTKEQPEMAADMHAVAEVFRKCENAAKKEEEAEEEAERAAYRAKQEEFQKFAAESVRTWEDSFPWAPGCGPSVVVEWSEVGALHEGSDEDANENGCVAKRYSVDAFDRITADLDRWMKEHDRGYYKVKFTIEFSDEMPSYTDRIDVGDGFGGIVGMLKSTVKYHEDKGEGGDVMTGFGGHSLDEVREVLRRLEDATDGDAREIDDFLDSLAG